VKKDVLFRGCTRPPMILGVPYGPFVVGAGTPLILAMYFSWFFLLAIPLMVFLMRMAAKKDEMIFRLVGLNLAFRFLPRNAAEYGGAWVFGAGSLATKRKQMKPYQ
jgi:type IV secretion system protein VirB3